MREIITFVGLGQAGGNICESLREKHFETAVINTSLQDLMTIQIIKKLYLGNSEGTAKNRNNAKAEFEKYKDNIVDFIKNIQCYIFCCRWWRWNRERYDCCNN